MSGRLGTLNPAHPLTIGESNALAGEGTIDAAIAGARLRFVYCDHGAIRGEDWHEHTHDFNQLGPDGDAVWAIEREPDYIEDCVLILGER